MPWDLQASFFSPILSVWVYYAHRKCPLLLSYLLCFLVSIMTNSKSFYINFSMGWLFSCITGSLQVLAHRLGLIPIFADPREFDFRSEGERWTLLHETISSLTVAGYFFSFFHGHQLQYACVTPVLVTPACVTLACLRLTQWLSNTHPTLTDESLYVGWVSVDCNLTWGFSQGSLVTSLINIDSCQSVAGLRCLQDY